jgi:2,4-dienoyl-CoA reductase-like NADH-dependent reductase (Old Yellow Enzyme family)
MIITGNVQVSSSHLTLGRDLLVPHSLSEDTLRPFRELSTAIHGQKRRSEESSESQTSTLAIMQLNHSGRQSASFLGGRSPFTAPLAPSAVRVGHDAKNQGILDGLVYWLMFQTPKAMIDGDIDEVVDQFIHGARLSHESGFDGVELHASHGCECPTFAIKLDTDLTTGRW